MLCLQASGAPPLLNFIKVLYTDVRVFVQAQGILKVAFFTKSEVLHGCPLSATLFVLALEPFLLDFHKTIVAAKSYGVLYACADDITPRCNQ